MSIKNPGRKTEQYCDGQRSTTEIEYQYYFNRQRSTAALEKRSYWPFMKIPVNLESLFPVGGETLQCI